MSKKSNDKVEISNIKETSKKEPTAAKPLINVIILELLFYFLYSFLKSSKILFLADVVLIILVVGIIAIIALVIYFIYTSFKKKHLEA